MIALKDVTIHFFFCLQDAKLINIDST
uniref:Uncharacterized protein n=1 Tax=Tetranychus urticae TaxID=32264 RepID=T1KFK1_TETUR